MALTGAEVLKRLLQANFFPRVAASGDELPPCFVSSTWSPGNARKLAARTGRKGGYDSIGIDITRYNLVPRRLEIPHPTAYARLAVVLADEWHHLSHVTSSSRSRIKPRAFADGRVVSMLGTRGRRISKFGSRFVASADINSFYPSLYTHALPWALVGHSHAKSNRSNHDWFNNIDLKLRDCKRGETTGVAIGPGTSAIAAELVLHAIDSDPGLKGYRYERFIDDYSLHAKSREEAEGFLTALEKALRRFNLTLNPRKTNIIELPIPRTPAWIRQLRAAAQQLGSANPQQFLDFIDLAVDVTQANSDASALKYALAILERRFSKVKRGADSSVIASALLSLGFHRPVVLPFLVRFVQRKRVTLSAPMQKHLNELIVHHAAAHRTDAVSWLLYLAKLQKIKVRKAAEQAVVGGADCLSLVLLWHAGEASAKRKVEAFARSLCYPSGDDYGRDQYWLLLFELERATVLKLPYGPGDTDFKLMIKDNVEFVDFKSKLKAPRRLSSISLYPVTE